MGQQQSSSLNTQTKYGKGLLQQYQELKTKLDQASTQQTVLSPENAQELINWIKSNFSACLFVENISKPKSTTVFEPLEKTTKSDSIQILAENPVQKVFLKLFVPFEGDSNSELEYEAMIYACVIPMLLKYCPFFVKFVGYERCPKLLGQLIDFSKSKTISPDLKPQIDKIIDNFQTMAMEAYRDPNEGLKRLQRGSINVLMTEQVAGGALLSEFFELIERNQFTEAELSVADLITIVFQLTWVVMTFSKFGIRHNDMRFGNFFIHNLHETKTFKLKYKTEDYYFKLPIRYGILCFDYDHGVVSGIVDNPYATTNQCPYGYGCNSENPGFDSYKVFNSLWTQLYHFGPNHRFKNAVKAIHDELKRYELVEFLDAPCMMAEGGFKFGDNPCPIALLGLDRENYNYNLPPTPEAVQKSKLNVAADQLEKIWKINPKQNSNEYIIPAPNWEKFLCQSSLFASFRSNQEKYLQVNESGKTAFAFPQTDLISFPTQDWEFEDVRVEIAKLIFKDFPAFPMKREYLSKILGFEAEMNVGKRELETENTSQEKKSKSHVEFGITEHWL